MKLCCTLSNNPWLIREFMCLLSGGAKPGIWMSHKWSERQPRYSRAQSAWRSALGTPCLYTSSCACGVNILAGVWNGLEHAAEQNPSPRRQQCSAQVSHLRSVLMKGVSCLVFFQCWLILNLSSLVDFKIKYRTIRDLLSHCLRVSNKNSPFVAGSVLGHFCNLFSSSVSKLTRLSCFHHSCLGGCSRSLLLWGSQAFCNKNVSPVLNSLIASLYMFVLVPQLCFQLKSFCLPMPQLCLFLQDTPITLLIQEASSVPGELGFALKGYFLKQGYWCFVNFVPALEKNLSSLWPMGVLLAAYVLLKQKSSMWEFSDPC